MTPAQVTHRPDERRNCQACGTRWPCLAAHERAIAAGRMRQVLARLERGEVPPGEIACYRRRPARAR